MKARNALLTLQTGPTSNPKTIMDYYKNGGTGNQGDNSGVQGNGNSNSKQDSRTKIKTLTKDVPKKTAPIVDDDEDDILETISKQVNIRACAQKLAYTTNI